MCCFSQILKFKKNHKIAIFSTITKMEICPCCTRPFNCLHLTIKQYLSSKTYYRKYEQLPNIVIQACKILQKKMNLLKMCVNMDQS